MLRKEILATIAFIIGGLVGFIIGKYPSTLPVPTPVAETTNNAKKVETPKTEEAKKEEPHKYLIQPGNIISQIAWDLSGHNRKEAEKLQSDIFTLNGFTTAARQHWIYPGYFLLIPAYVKIPKEYQKEVTASTILALRKSEAVVAPASAEVEETQLLEKTTDVESKQEVIGGAVVQPQIPSNVALAPIEIPKDITVATFQITDTIGAQSQSVTITATVDEQGNLKTTTTAETPSPVATPSKSEEQPVQSPRATQAAYRVQVPHGTVQGMKPGKLAAYIVHTNAAGKLVHEETAVSVAEIDGGFEWTIPHTTELGEDSALAFDTGGKDGKVVLIPGQVVQSKASPVWIEPSASKLNKKAYSRLSKNYAPKRRMAVVILKRATPIAIGVVVQGPYVGLAMGGFSLIADAVRTRNVTTIQIESLAGKLDDINRRLTELEKEKESK